MKGVTWSQPYTLKVNHMGPFSDQVNRMSENMSLKVSVKFAALLYMGFYRLLYNPIGPSINSILTQRGWGGLGSSKDKTIFNGDCIQNTMGGGSRTHVKYNN